MKSMTCSQLGGACEEVFTADAFEEISAMSQNHGKVMFGKNDAAHMQKMGEMMEIMNSGKMDAWMAARRAEFENL